MGQEVADNSRMKTSAEVERLVFMCVRIRNNISFFYKVMIGKSGPMLWCDDFIIIKS